ncbi:GMC oxidoreductase [Colletotrichum camelliae]|nr:GMC oxidoreductase [Colletotrichum camelliae]
MMATMASSRHAVAGTLAVLLAFLSHVSGLRVPHHATVASRVVAANTEYDFLIAGGGISGLTVADRLTEDPNVNVLVIETGPFDKDEDSVLIPGAFNPVPYLWPDLISALQTELNNRSFLVPAGRVVGGGSVVNGMVFVRAGKAEVKTSRRLRKISPTLHAAHGRGGPVQASYPNYFFPGAANFWQAALESGFTPSPDPLAGDHAVGLFNFPTLADATTRTRSHARRNHYTRVKDARPNYHILAEHTVSRVLFEGKRAVGVEYLPTAGGEKVSVYATKEVLLAAGGAHTPQLLQLSGIGNREFLEGLGIEVVEDLPGVGENFQDQADLKVPYTFTNQIFPNSGSLDTNATYDAEQRALYDTAKQGAYTIIRTLGINLVLPPLSNATSTYRTLLAAAAATDPLAHLAPETPPSVQEGYKLQRELIITQLAGQEVPVGMIHWGTGPSLTLYFLKPLSRGSVRIRTADPLAQPVIDFRTGADPVDFDVAIALFEKAREVMAALAMQVLGPAGEYKPVECA